MFLWIIWLILAASNCQAASPQAQSSPQADAPWTFGHSKDRHNPLWRKSNSGEIIVKKTKPKTLTKNQGSIDTTRSIGRALDVAADRAVEEKMKKSAENSAAHPPRVRGSMGLSMEDESSAWKVNPDEVRIDEYVPRNRKHVVRAFAGMKANDDLDIRVGPELHVRDDSTGMESAYEKEPDTTLGVGMHFKFDF